jgi:hypothetical protein
MLRGYPPGITTSGTASDQAWATAPKAFSMPGPTWQQKTPTLSPEVMRLMASAMWTPTRSWRTTIGRMLTAAADSVRGLSG